MKVVFSLFIVCAAILSAYAGTPYQPCASKSIMSYTTILYYFIYALDFNGTIAVTGVDVPGCTGPPCLLKKGTTATIAITFKPSERLGTC